MLNHINVPSSALPLIGSSGTRILKTEAVPVLFIIISLIILTIYNLDDFIK